MMKRITLLLFVAAVPAFTWAQAAKGTRTADESHTPASFIENKGQIADNTGKRRDDVLFTTTLDGATMFMRNTGISYVFYKEKAMPAAGNGERVLPDASPSITQAYRMDWELIGANAAAEISGEEAGNDTLNFYYAHCPDGVTGVKNYGRVCYKNIYPQIDLVFYHKNEQLEYDFVVHPGGDPAAIHIRMLAAGKVVHEKNGSLSAVCPMGTVTEQAPIGFLQENAAAVNVAFRASGDDVSFSVNDYDKTKTLVIDPAVRTWGTYFGGLSSDHITDMAYYDSGSPSTSYYYVTGTTSSTTFIASTGAYDVALYGGHDAFVAKFNINGARSWSTYYGGENDDYATSIAYNSTSGSTGIGICGYTTSWAGMSTSGTIQPVSTGEDFTLIEYEGFVAKFNSSGTRVWGTFYGSLGADFPFSIAPYFSGGFLVGGRTQAYDVYNPYRLASPGAIQPTINNVNDDGFLASFSSTGTRNWGTYFGGANGMTSINDIAVEPSTLYIDVVGETTVPSNFATIGAYDVSYGGSKDGFLARFYNTGTSLLGCSYYGGTGLDQAQSVTIDPVTNNVYIAGYTASTASIATSGAYQTVYGGTGDAFLVKMTAGFNSRLWSTYCGGSAAETGARVCVDAHGSSFLACATSSTGMSTTDSWQPTPGGADDACITKFNAAGARLWGTYYGGTSTDAASAIQINSTGLLAMAGFSGSTNTSNVIASSGAYQTTMKGVDDGFIAQFRDNDIVVSSLPTLSFCQGQTFTLSYTVDYAFNAGNTFFAQLSDYAGSFAAATNIGAVGSTTSGTISCTIPLTTPAGSGYRIRIVGVAPVIIGVPNAVNLTIKNKPATPVISLTTPLCAGQPEYFWASFILGATYTWSGQNGFSANTQTPSLPTTSLLSEGNYSVVITVDGCDSDPGTAYLDMMEAPLYQHINVTGKASFCEGDSVLLGITPAAGCTYQWYLNGNPIPGATNPDYTAKVAGNYTVVATLGTCPTTMNTVTVSTFTCRIHDNAVGETDPANNLQLFPNPSTGTFTLNAAGLSGSVNIVVTDVSGRVVLSKTAVPVNGILLENLALENAGSGVYFVSLHDGEKTQVQKLILVK